MLHQLMQNAAYTMLKNTSPTITDFDNNLYIKIATEQAPDRLRYVTESRT